MKIPTTDEFFGEIKKVTKSLPEKATLVLEENWHDRVSPELVHPVNSLPNGKNLSIVKKYSSCEQIDSKEKKSETKSGDQNKLSDWLKYKCGQSKEIPESLWREEPLIHPLGGSWAYWVFVKDSKDKAWAEKNQQFFHVLELPKVLPEKPLLRKLNFSILESLLFGRPVFVSDGEIYIMIDEDNRHVKYKIFDIQKVQRLIDKFPLAIVRDPKTACLEKLGERCLVVSPSLSPERVQRFWRGAILAGVFAFILAFVFFWEMRKFALSQKNQKQLAVMALAHELRHPTTSISLSTEIFRDCFDDLPEKAQKEFFRMVDEIKRLKRLVTASEQYLLTSTDGFEFKIREIESLNSYFSIMCRSYNIKFIPLEKDQSFRCDPYWLGVCLENLIKNAKKHGSEPIELKAAISKGRLLVEVSDQGEGIQGPLKKALKPFDKSSRSDGLGLGLTLVSQVVKNMGGVFRFEANPSRFIIGIGEAK